MVGQDWVIFLWWLDKQWARRAQLFSECLLPPPPSSHQDGCKGWVTSQHLGYVCNQVGGQPIVSKAFTELVACSQQSGPLKRTSFRASVARMLRPTRRPSPLPAFPVTPAYYDAPDVSCFIKKLCPTIYPFMTLKGPLTASTISNIKASCVPRIHGQTVKRVLLFLG
jgi:hypothetical protein